ncbi:MAG: Fe2+-dependent dioxygenase [Alphaproteobacteria bacterium]|nr:Fe2+-dependent dioxygenase [Alphaproteobacteria bacterium]MBU1514028.1 Fe2+-dependent dioxygenase [Alphaproteobacteria bacterium]MBU2093032.1 Fe2+-dependent dioxygenase [Alphaproteobacteria bacterium]MBU2151765.1 Fe2+-dependent dioxygenase [Alphaproteobacteria bacterium]MBU2309415.1 Fe2+-dependent dioxygenase [Alphaproteobacteria bacterium]
MFCEIPDLLTPAEVAELRHLATRLRFVDGKVTNPGSLVKNNLQGDLGDPQHERASAILRAALSRSPLFVAFAFPKLMAPPSLSLYRLGMNYGAHADAAFLPIGGRPIRADLSCTMFLTDPADYDGGELSVRLGTREIDFKPAPGGAVVYPSTTIHQVRPVTRGERLCGITFIESDIVDRNGRELLFELNDILAAEGERLTWEARTRLSHVATSLHRQWGDAG